MKKLSKQIIENIEYYNKLYMKIKNIELPEGSLSIYKNNNTVQYYQVIDKKRKYIKKNNSTLIKKLAQKSYLLKVKRYLISSIDLLTQMNKFFDNDLDEFYENLSDERKKLIEPIKTTKKEKIKIWKESFPNNELIKLDTYMITKKGVYVRNSSEKMIADRLEEMNITYIYEKPLFLDGFGYTYPTFTFYSTDINDEIYWEHFDIIEDSEYYQDVLSKIDNYAKNGIFLGDRLIISFEDIKEKVNLQTVELQILKYLK